LASAPAASVADGAVCDNPCDVARRSPNVHANTIVPIDRLAFPPFHFIIVFLIV
jgi:hypothetical protein